jgi:hypothetical protein
MIMPGKRCYCGQCRAPNKEIAKEKNLPTGDFEDPTVLQQKLTTCDFSKFNKLDKKLAVHYSGWLPLGCPQH